LTIEAIRSGRPSPIPFDELVEVTETTFLVQQALAMGEVLRLNQLAQAAAIESPSSNPVQQDFSLTA
jgi:hypothetical protein